MAKPRLNSQKAQAKKRADNKEYARKLKALKKTGIYSTDAKSLSSHQKSKINKLYNTYKNELENDDVIFVPYPSHVSKPKMKKRVEALKLKATNTGLFIQKDGQRKGSIEFDRQYQEYRVRLTGKAKFGNRVGQKITTYIPLAKIDEIAIQKERLKNQADELSKNLKPNERLRYRVVETGNDGFSNSIFSSAEFAFDYLNRYDSKPIPSRIGFFRHLIVEKIEYSQHNIDVSNKASKQFKKRKVNKQGRNV